MARRMYDLDNGTEDIKVKSIETNAIVNTEMIVLDSPEITFDSPFIDFLGGQARLGNFSTILRPQPYSEGVIIYDTTLKKCILYNGTDWVNLDGTDLS